MEEADKMFEEVVQVEKIACFLGSWWGGSANLSNFIKGKCHMGKWHIIALFEQINTDHKKQQSKVLVAALSMLDVSYFVVDCERSIWAVDRHSLISSWEGLIVTLSIFPCPQGRIIWSTPCRKFDDERMSVLHQNSGGIGKFNPSSPKISLRLRPWEISWVSENISGVEDGFPNILSFGGAKF